MNGRSRPHREAIEADQLEKLNRLLEVLLDSNPFYQAKLSGAGIDGPVKSLDEFTEKMPFTTKDEVLKDQEKNPPFGTNLTYPIVCYTRYNQTSGTTGLPLRWADTPESWQWMVDNWIRVYKESGVKPGERVFFAFSFGPFLGFWTAFEAAANMECLCIPGGGMSSVARLQAILANEATVLCCTPTYAIRLGETAEDEKIDLGKSKIRTIIVGGEPGAGIAGIRERIASLWKGAKICDHHGMTEVGPVSFESPLQRGVLHAIEGSYLVEAIDPESGAGVAEGEEGELVLTTLGRLGSPLLRYRTGDRARLDWSGAGRYGRNEVALVGGILGRIDDMVIVRGVNIHPSAVDEIVHQCEGIAEYRMEIRDRQSMTELSMIVEPRRGFDQRELLVKRLDAAFQTAFNLRIPVTVVAPGGLPEFEMKARRWIRV